MIDILIKYNNNLEDLYKTLFSLGYQDISSTFNVYVVSNNDIDISFFSKFFSIECLNSDSDLTDICLKNTNGSYVFFMNCGDTFADVVIMRHLFVNVFNSKYDYVCNDDIYFCKRNYLLTNNGIGKKIEEKIFVNKENNNAECDIKLDIIIPYYNSYNSCIKTLASICMQDFKKNIKVTIIDDCSPFKYNFDDFKKYIDLRIVKLNKNSGPGVVRQYGIDVTNNPYIMFIDSDDVFVNSKSLNVVFKNMKSEYDLIFCRTIYEQNDLKLFNSRNNTVLHGKCFKREYLRKNNIRFSKYRRSEENSFVNICLLFNPNIVRLSEYIYFYHYTKNSITNSNDYHEDLNYAFDFVYNIQYYCSYINDFVSKKVVREFFAHCFFWLWKIYNNEFDNKNIDNFIDTIKAIYKYYDKFEVHEFICSHVIFSEVDFDYVINYNDFIELIKNYND